MDYVSSPPLSPILSPVKACSEEDPLEMPQQLDFAQRSLRKHGMVEWCDALDGDGRAGRDVDRSAACQP
jgi:hypothetical protein